MNFKSTRYKTLLSTIVMLILAILAMVSIDCIGCGQSTLVKIKAMSFLIGALPGMLLFVVWSLFEKK